MGMALCSAPNFGGSLSAFDADLSNLMVIREWALFLGGRQPRLSGGAPALPNFGDSRQFMRRPTPFVAELPIF